MTATTSTAVAQDSCLREELRGLTENEPDERMRSVLSRTLDRLDIDDFARLQASGSSLPENLKQIADGYWAPAAHLKRAARLILHLNLDNGQPLRIAYFGRESGYFLFVAKCLGHNVVAISRPFEVYDRLLSRFSIPAIAEDITPNGPMSTAAPFDLILGTSIDAFTINTDGTKSYWGAGAWETFFLHCAEKLSDEGRLFLMFNKNLLDGESQRPLVSFLQTKSADFNPEKALILLTRAQLAKTSSPQNKPKKPRWKIW